MKYFIANFYQFIEPTTPLAQLKEELTEQCRHLDLLGTILLSDEGANFSLTGAENNIKSFITWLNNNTEFDIKDYRSSWGDQRPYPRLKVNIQPSIITFLGDEDPKVADVNAGERLDPEQWDQTLLSNKDVVLVDTRNQYEMDWGKFKDADGFDIKSFSEFPEKFTGKYKLSENKDKVFLFYCTGGIRCEKVTAWAKNLGYKNCFQLDGGILKYLETHEKKDSRWEGDCFVFDRRWAVDNKRQEADACQYTENPIQPKQYFDKEINEHFACD